VIDWKANLPAHGRFVIDETRSIILHAVVPA